MSAVGSAARRAVPSSETRTRSENSVSPIMPQPPRPVTMEDKGREIGKTIGKGMSNDCNVAELIIEEIAEGLRDAACLETAQFRTAEQIAKKMEEIDQDYPDGCLHLAGPVGNMGASIGRAADTVKGALETARAAFNAQNSNN